MPKTVPQVVNNELVFFRKYSDKKYSDPWSRKRATPRLHYYQIKMVREAGVGECLKHGGNVNTAHWKVKTAQCRHQLFTVEHSPQDGRLGLSAEEGMKAESC